MQQSDSIAALVAALAKAQMEVRNPSLDRAHPHFKGFRYASLGSHLDAIREPFAKHGLIVTQGVNSEGDRVSVTTQIAHTSGEWMRATVGITLAERAKAQDLGAAVTYLRRYAIASIAMLTGDDDTDADEDRAAKEPPRREPPRQESRRDVFDPTPVAKPSAPASKGSMVAGKWGAKGADCVRPRKIAPRGDGVTAVLCDHAVHGSQWVAFPEAVAAAITEGSLIDIEWKWNDKGFYESAVATPVKRTKAGDIEIPF